MDTIETPQSLCTVKIGYNKKSQKLFVKFTSGKTYQYFGVPESVWNGLLATIHNGFSIGKFINSTVKRFDCRLAK